MVQGVVLVPCARCGVAIIVPEDELAEYAGRGVVVRHEDGKCPTDAVPDRLNEYEVQIIVLRRQSADVDGEPGWVEDKLLDVRAKASALTLKSALPEINGRLNELWGRVQQTADMAEGAT
jgi:hypothetical protein